MQFQYERPIWGDRGLSANLRFVASNPWKYFHSHQPFRQRGYNYEKFDLPFFSYVRKLNNWIMVKATMRSWLLETLLQYMPMRCKHHSTSHVEPIYQIDNGEFIIEFMFGREGYSVHSITSHVTNDAVFFICGSRVGGLKVINGLTGVSIVENVFLTSTDLTMIYEGDDSYLFSCGRESSIPCWFISASGQSKYLSSLIKHSNTVSTIDSICVTSLHRNMIVSRTNYLASGSHDHSIVIWEFHDKKWLCRSVFQKHNYVICKIKFFTMVSDVMIASSDHAGNFLVWNINDQSIYFEHTLHGPIHCISASNQTKSHPAILAVVDAVGMVNVFNMNRKQLLYTLGNNTYQEFIRTVVIYDQGDNRILIGGCDDGSIHFWSLVDGDLFHCIRRHRSWVNTIHITDGSTPLLVSGGCDSRVCCWNLKRIICNIKYGRRKNYLMFLVGSGFQNLHRGEEYKDDNDYPCQDFSKLDVKCMIACVFSNQDLCAMIAKFL